VRHPETLGDTDGRADPEEPRRIGRYLVIERVGQGAMGVVYAAFDPELSRKLAIKLLHPGGDDEVARGRLVREAQALARLSHPNVVQIYDVGTRGGAVWVAMEFAEGQTLREWLAADRDRPWRDVLAVVCDAGRGLAAAHGVGIVHRDMKPDNVLVGTAGDVRVVDFGLARAADGPESPVVDADAGPPNPGAADAGASEPDAAAAEAHGPIAEHALGLLRPGDDETASDSLGERMTRTGARLGTPAYMAPEQWTSGAIDARTDQFAFCVLAWEALYGIRPFVAQNLTTLGFAITQGRVVAPPTRSGVPAWIQRLLLQGLRVDPRERHADMPTLLRALEHDPAVARRRALLAAAATVAVGTSVMVGTRLGRGEAEDPCAMTAAALDGVWDAARRERVAAALRATGRSYAEDTWTRVDANVGAWAERFVAARRDACEATHVRREASADALDLRIACLDRGRVALGALAEVLESADAGVLDRAVRSTGALPEPEQCADVEALRDAAVRPEDPAARDEAARLREVVAHAGALEQAGRYAEAKAALVPVKPDVEALGWAPLTAEFHEIAGTIAFDDGDAVAAADELGAAYLAAVEGRHDRVAWSSATARAGALAELPTRLSEARAACDLAHAHWVRGAYGPRAEAIVESARFRVEAAAGDYVAARRHIERSIALRDTGEHTEDADLAGALANFGSIVGMLGESELAIRSLRRAVAIRERVQSPGHPEVGRELHNLGSMLARSGAFGEAAPMLGRALTIKREALGPAHPDLSYTLTALGNVAVSRGAMDEAQGHLQAAVEVIEGAHGPDHPDLAYALLGLGDLAIRDGRPQDALPPLRRALQIREQAQGADHPEVAYVLIALGVASMDDGDAAAGVRHLERAHRLLATLPDPVAQADVAWPLARARWRADLDRAAAVELARGARDAYAAANGPQSGAVAEIDAWLADPQRVLTATR